MPKQRKKNNWKIKRWRKMKKRKCRKKLMIAKTEKAIHKTFL